MERRIVRKDIALRRRKDAKQLLHVTFGQDAPETPGFSQLLVGAGEVAGGSPSPLNGPTVPDKLQWRTKTFERRLKASATWS